MSTIYTTPQMYSARPTVAECAGCEYAHPGGLADWDSPCINCVFTSGRPSRYKAANITISSMAEHSPPVDEKNDELKPCPFCGGKPVLSSWELLNEYSVSCSECHAVPGDYEDTKEKAIKRWNRRMQQ